MTLGVDDLERSLAFYREGLGLPSQGIVGQLIVQLARIREWSLSGPDGELSEPDQAVLIIQLG